jgi:MerR family mercuric resistance operon transcriptional regulator
MTIGELARQSGVGIETIRFYERRGLIEKPERPESGFRKYAPEIVSRVRFIRRAKELGFSLREISELLAFRVTPETSCTEVKTRAEKKIADIDSKIESLRAMRNALAKLVSACRMARPTGECPILEALEQRGDRR